MLQEGDVHFVFCCPLKVVYSEDLVYLSLINIYVCLDSLCLLPQQMRRLSNSLLSVCIKVLS